MVRAHIRSGGRYPVLRALAILYMLGALGALCYGLYYLGWELFAAPGTAGERATISLQIVAATFFGVITILALAELIKLLIDVEHNTRVAGLHGANGNGATASDHGANRIADSADEESAEAALLRGH